MASINKLSIRGVRAFSPEDQEQVIEFYFPVTIIVGANGCGKTTIIESLKYAVTGALPPGRNPGQAFVHDPKSVGQSVVKANIKLRLTNLSGNQMVVVRSMEVTQKKSTMSFKALDGILRMTDANTGERMSSSHKCGELDKTIPNMLGVSKPILDNVVFCHQEDSSWPLMEGAVLKKRFDDIFDSTRYAKALKAIQETRKEYQGTVKDLKADLNGLASHKHAAKGFRQELSEQKVQLEALEEKIQAVNDEMRALEKKKEENEKIYAQVSEIRCELDDRTANLEKEQSVIATRKSMLREDLTEKHSARDLKDMLRDYDDTVAKHNDRKHDLEMEMKSITDAIESIRKEDSALLSQLGKLQAEKEAYERTLQSRLAKMEHMAQEFGIMLPVTQTQATNASFTATQGSLASETVATQDTAISVSKEDMRAFLTAVNDKDGEYKENLNNHREQSQVQMDHVQNQLNELNAKNKSIEHEKQKLENEQSEARGEFTQLNSQAQTHTRIRKSDIEDTRRQAVHFAKERDKLNNDRQLKDIPVQIRSYEGQIDKLRRDIEYDQQVLKDLRSNTDAQNSITVLREQTRSELESLKESLSDSSFVFQKYNLQAPATLPGDGDDNGNELVDVLDTFASAIREKYDNVQHDLDKAKGDQTSKNRVVSEKSALLAHNKQSLTNLRNRIDAFGLEDSGVTKFKRIVNSIRQYEQGAGMQSTFQGNDPQEVLSHLTKQIEELETRAQNVLSPDTVTKVMETLLTMSVVRNEQNEAVRQACPCCRRDFTGIEDFDVFKDTIDELKDPDRSDLLRSDRQQAERDRSAKQNYQRWRKAVSESMHDVMEFNRISTESKDTEVVVKDLENEVTTLETDVNKLKDTCSDLETDANELRDLVDSTKRWTEDARRISRKKMEIGQKQVDLSVSTSHMADRDLQTVEDSFNKNTAEKDELMNKINSLNKTMSELNNKISTLSQQATRFENLVRDKQAKYDEEQESNVRKGQLRDRIKAISDETKKLHDQGSQLRNKIRSKEADLKRLRASSKEEEDRLNDLVSKFGNEVSQLRNLISDIECYESSNKGQDLDRINEKMEALTQRTKEKEAEKANLDPELDELNKAIADQERHKKLIQENLELLQAGSRIKELEKQIERLEEDMEQVEGSDKCMELLNECTVRITQLTEKRAKHTGRRTGYVDQIRTLERKLKTPEYKDIDERHRVCMIKHETTVIAVSDLEKYHSALDKALCRFHGIKIAEINRIIRELWTLTYKGDDITNIELVSGQDGGSKKSYNYRVVMTKGSTQLDMRGRCSAGQRVLACIVIRLALAETFCVNCGIVALDEPTVNLDYNNKRGLAIALAQIIGLRAQQSNFQLVVITHDEDFVGMMKTELSTQSGFDMPEKYFQVRREESSDGKFYSKIDAIDWDELL